MAADNKTLGRFVLDGIPSAPRGVPQIEVSFSIDANGILNVKAVDLATKKEQKITITASTGLKDEEIDRMVAEAEKNAEEDKKKKERAEKRNDADSLSFNALKMIDENKLHIFAFLLIFAAIFTVARLLRVFTCDGALRDRKSVV